MEPLSGTDVPFNVALTAFFVVQVMTDDWPLVIDDGLAEAPAATGPVVGAVTVTVTWPQSVVPDVPVAVKR